MPGGISPENLDAAVLVVGAGPAGLAIASCLKRDGIDFVLVDRDGEIGGAYRRIAAETQLLSPARYTELPGLAIANRGEYVSAGQYHDYLRRYAEWNDLQVVKASVDQINPTADGLEVFFSNNGIGQTKRYPAVVLATGIFDHPVRPAILGLGIGADGPRVIHSSDWQNVVPGVLGRILIIGAGMSGVEIAEQCAAAGVKATISSKKRIRLWRRSLFGVDIHHFVHLFAHRIPLWMTGSYCQKLPALRAFDRGFREGVRAGWIIQRGEVCRFEGKQAVFQNGTQEDFDMVVVATGYRWAPACLPEQAETGDLGQPMTSDGRVHGVPGLFVIGAPCGRMLPSEFLRGVALDAPEIAKLIAKRLMD